MPAPISKHAWLEAKARHLGHVDAAIDGVKRNQFWAFLNEISSMPFEFTFAEEAHEQSNHERTIPRSEPVE